MGVLLTNLGIGLHAVMAVQPMEFLGMTFSFPMNIFYCFLGALIGTVIGVLPGIGPIATIAMLLPATYALSPEAGLIMLAGIYYGAQYGGSTTAILVNLPGEISSVVTCIEGYQMGRRGRGGVALTTAAVGSFFAGCVATVVLAAFAPPLARVAVSFGSTEYFSLMVLGLIGSVVLASGSLVKAICMTCLGLLGGLVGTDVNSGVLRYTFDIPELSDGIGFVAVAMGVFGFAEVINTVGRKKHGDLYTSKVTTLFPTKEDWKRMILPILRGTGLGSFLGMLPGGGATLASFGSYVVEKKTSKFSAEFGKGAIEGVAGPESANNAAAQTSFIPHVDPGHSIERGDGADDRSDDDSRYPARPASDDQQPDAVLGSDRFDVVRQLDAADLEPAADRHLGQTAVGALPPALPGHSGLLLYRRLHRQQQRF